MKFAAMVLGVCHPQKLFWMPQTLESIDTSKDFIFDSKILAIDEFAGWKLPAPLEAKFTSSGWKVIKDSHKSRPLSMRHGLQIMSEDICFYHEDDVLVQLPPREKLEILFNTTLEDGRTCGMVSLTLGGSRGWWYHGAPDQIGDLEFIEENRMLTWDQAFAFKRIDTMADEFFMEFPALFIRKDILGQCIDHALIHHRGDQIEQGLTRSWFDLKLSEKYFKCSIALPNLPQVLKEEHKEMFRKCRLLTNLDPNQGNSAYFGNHNI